jgi:hypothetical protein
VLQALQVQQDLLDRKVLLVYQLLDLPVRKETWAQLVQQDLLGRKVLLVYQLLDLPVLLVPLVPLALRAQLAQTAWLQVRLVLQDPQVLPEQLEQLVQTAWLQVRLVQPVQLDLKEYH